MYNNGKIAYIRPPYPDLSGTHLMGLGNKMSLLLFTLKDTLDLMRDASQSKPTSNKQVYDFTDGTGDISLKVYQCSNPNI